MPKIAPPSRSTPQLCVAAALAFWFLSPPTPAQQGGGIAASPSTIHFVRALVGAKGEARNGQFVMTDARSTFYAPEDHEVIVYFEWEGPTGIHHCEGSVRGPGGEFATMSSFDYTATQHRFAGFWKVPLSQGTPPGGWTFESRVDGHSAGEVSFQVVVAAKPAGLAVELAAPALPSPNDIYTRTVASTVDVEKLDAQGHSLHHSSGFVLKDGIVVTSFRAIDGATNLRLHFADSDSSLSPVIAAWDRHQDWVILSTSPKTAPSLKLAQPKSWKVGDQCYWLDVKADGSRILSDGQIVGFKSRSPWGDRIDFSGTYDAAGLGGALLNDRGEVIGVLGGALPESLVNTNAPQLQADSQLLFYTQGGIAVAANLLPQSLPSSSVSLQDLWAKGLMTPPLIHSDYILFGMLTNGSKLSNRKLNPGERDYKIAFQRGDTAAALIHFSNSTSFKTTATLKLYDVDNHLVATSKTDKINVNRGDFTEHAWQVPLGNLPTGVYRVDVEFPEGVSWRQYFQLND
jgi:hypothetical protein